MLWKVERFDAKAARGWVCLPDRSASARLFVYAGNGDPFVLDCNFMRDDIKRLGLHETGQCGFFIGPKVMKELYQAPTAAIFEETSRLLLYRHSSEANFVDSRLLFLTAPAVDASGAMASLSAHHRLSYGNAESMDDETLTYLFKQTHWTSILICAALGHRPKAVDRALASGKYTSVTLLSRPSTVFMRQVATLASAAKDPEGQRRLISDPDLAEITDRLGEADLRRPEGIETWLANAPESGLAKLSNPLVRFYSGASLDDPITSSHLSTALRTIGSTDAVGLTERLAEFSATVGALIGVPDLAIAAEAPHPETRATLEAATQAPGVAALVSYDQRLYDLTAYALTAEQPSLDAAGKILRS